MNENNIFDVNQPVSIRLQSPSGVKLLTIRFPNDAEWTERQRKRKLIIRQLGRGISETISPDSSEFDLDLIKKLCSEEDPDIDSYEASRILDDLNLADVEEVAPDGDGYRVMLRVAGRILTSHIIAIPSAKDIFQFRRGYTAGRDLPHNRQQLIVNLEAAAELDKKLRKSTDGYAGAVPIIHQAAVIRAVVDEIESGFGVADSENF